jgi:YkoY family integral membrane protein
LIVGTLIILEGLLSADNALVLALLVRHLPQDQQKKALQYGLFGAFALRGLGIYLARYIIALWWLCGLGALYLIFLALKHFFTPQHHETDEAAQATGGVMARKKGMGFWQTVAVVEFTDVIFAVDSILVAVALVNDPRKLWIVYTGGFLGIILLRLAAGLFIGLIRKYPTLDNMAYALVGWAGVKLASTAGHLYGKPVLGYNLPELPKPVFWIVFGLIVVVGVVTAMRHKRNAADDADQRSADEALRDLQESGFASGGGARVYSAPPDAAATTVPPADSPPTRTTTPTR